VLSVVLILSNLFSGDIPLRSFRVRHAALNWIVV